MSDHWRNPLSDKTRILLFAPNSSEEQLIERERAELAEIGEPRGIWAAYDGPPKERKLLRIEHGLFALHAWTKSRLSETGHPPLRTASVYFLLAPSEEWLPDAERDAALALIPQIQQVKAALPWLEKARAKKDSLDERILRDAGIECGETLENSVSEPHAEVQKAPEAIQDGQSAGPRTPESKANKHSYIRSTPKPIGDLEAIRKTRSLNQREVAAEFYCSDRTVRNMAAGQKLTKTQKGRIVVDEKFVDQFNQRHSPRKK